MGQATQDMQPFDEACKATDWSDFEHMPMFQFADRMNANARLLKPRHRKTSARVLAPVPSTDDGRRCVMASWSRRCS